MENGTSGSGEQLIRVFISKDNIICYFRNYNLSQQHTLLYLLRSEVEFGLI